MLDSLCATSHPELFSALLPCSVPSEAGPWRQHLELACGWVQPVEGTGRRSEGRGKKDREYSFPPPPCFSLVLWTWLCPYPPTAPTKEPSFLTHLPQGSMPHALFSALGMAAAFPQMLLSGGSVFLVLPFNILCSLSEAAPSIESLYLHCPRQVLFPVWSLPAPGMLSSLLWLKYSRQDTASGSFHILFHFPGMLIPQISAQLTPLPPSGLRFNVT